MKRNIAAVMLAMLIMTATAMPAFSYTGETKIITNDPRTEYIQLELGGSGVNMTRPTDEDKEWIDTGKSGRAADGSIQIALDGKYVRGDAKPFIDEANRTQAPFRLIGEALGCNVDWSGEDEKVTCTIEGRTVEMFIGNSTYWVNGNAREMDTAPQIKDGRTFVPVRALGEALDCQVAWNPSALLVLIYGPRK